MSIFDKVDEHDQNLARRENSVAVGIVSDRQNHAKWGPICRFTLPDQDGKVTGWIPVGQKSCVGTAHYHLPRIGERMLLHKLGNGPEAAIATHALYSVSVSAPPQGNEDNHHTTFDDGSTLTVAPGSGIHIVATNALSLDVNAATTFNANGMINITCGGTVMITAPTINLNGVIIDSSGNVTIPGNLTVQGTTSLQLATANPHCTNTDGSGNGS